MHNRAKRRDVRVNLKGTLTFKIEYPLKAMSRQANPARLSLAINVSMAKKPFGPSSNLPM
jgi:hypothetical protein